MKKPKIVDVELFVDGEVYDFLTRVARSTELKASQVAAVIITVEAMKLKSKKKTRVRSKK